MSLPERTAYVDATTERGARLKIAAAVAGLEGVRPEDVDYRICNVKPAGTCIEEGESEDHELRLFEIGWCGDGIVFVREPLILLQQPGPRARGRACWKQLAGGSKEARRRSENLHKNNANADGGEPSRSAIKNVFVWEGCRACRPLPVLSIRSLGRHRKSSLDNV
jgi:hypothetical protein